MWCSFVIGNPNPKPHPQLQNLQKQERSFNFLAMSKANPQVITCKGEPIKEEEIEVDPPKAGEVRIKILCASLCHSDIIWASGYPLPLFPRVLGHEGVGEIESIGEGVSDLKVGDIVIPMTIGECQKCENCVSGKTNLCYKYPLPLSGLMPDGTSRMQVKGQMLYHLFSCSTWSEYTVIDSNYVVKIDPKLPLAHASFISCGFSTGFGATWKEAGVEKGSSVAVFGLGTVGLGAVEGARVNGAAKIFGIDKNGRKKEKGEAFGATDFLNPDEYDKPISEVIKDLTGGIGVDYAIECTGHAPLLNQAMESTKMGKGATVAVGVGSTTAELNFISLLNGRSVKGSIIGGIKPKTDIDFVIDKCMNKEINLDELLTHEVSLAEGLGPKTGPQWVMLSPQTDLDFGCFRPNVYCTNVPFN
ncbi:Alcohol dehydrogenase-like, C-terminal [Dillenia turbinata]|uniref:Alcohol dehydrogenase-like, C-terminal n=1 Tax=Dillenia turbinata TaxID=194707 RepID=A0AAN8ZJI0_9MAGN